MPMFSIQRRIPSCLVTRDLVEALENYILRRARELTETDGKQIDPTNFAVEIVESAGTGHLSSTTQFEGTRFFNGTKRIDVAYSRYTPRLKIQVQFDPDRFDSFLNVEYSGVSPRETVIGIAAGLKEILSSLVHSAMNPGRYTSTYPI
jgi:hypothetical protein